MGRFAMKIKKLGRKLSRFIGTLLGRVYKYSSVYIVLPSEYSQKIMDWSKKNIPDEVLVENDNANGRETESHVTVLYGLHSNCPDEAKLILQSFKSFPIEFGNISKFETDTHDVIKIEVLSNELRLLNILLKSLDHTSTFPTYNPHCTIAYVKKGSCDHLLGNFYFDDLVINVNQVIYSVKGGAKTPIDLYYLPI
jgi:hypothetical protein